MKFEATVRDQGSDFNFILGDLGLSIVGLRNYRASFEPCERILFVREPENRHDANAIRVENMRGQQIGYLPRSDAKWLTPLLDARQICISGNVPKPAAGSHEELRECPVRVTVAQLDAQLFNTTGPHTPAELLHPVIEAAYQQALSVHAPESIDSLIAGLAPLAKQDLLPQTQLRLALLPNLAEQLRQDQTITIQANFCAALANLQVMQSVAYGALTIFPLTWADSQPPGYMLLQSAIEQGLALVEEVSQNGSVPTVRLDNRATRPLLLPEGEILVGSKQNRTINLTLLVAAHSQFDIPVSCVEQGRWRYTSPQFQASAYAPPNLRAGKLRSIHRNRSRHGRVESDQQEVWSCVAAMLDSAGVESTTNSLTDALDSPAPQTQMRREPLELPSEAAGIVVARGQQVIGVDLFDSPDTMAAFWGRLSQAYCFLARNDSPFPAQPTAPELSRGFLDQLANQAQIRPSSLGLGHEVTVNSENLAGTGVIFEGRICHLAAFATSI